MRNIEKNSQSTNSKKGDNPKKRIPLTVLITTFFTCFFNQLKRLFLKSKQNDVAENEEKSSKFLRNIFFVAVVIFIIVILLESCSNTFYTGTGVYQKIEADENQEAIVEDSETTQLATLAPEIDFDNHKFDNSVSLYSRGNVASAVNNKVSVDVYNIKDSNVNMILEIYIPDDELFSKIGTNGRTESSQKEVDLKVEAAKNSNSSYSPAVCIAKSGLIFPGNKITTLDLETLENGTALPSGEYRAFYKETFYDDNGNLQSVDASLAITLIVQ